MRDRLQPARQELDRHEDRREEQRQEDRQLHERRGLQRPEAHRHAGRPQQPDDVDEGGERVEREDVDAVSADLHPCEHRDRGQDERGHRPPADRADPVAEQDAAPVGRRHHQAPREAGLEVADDPEAGENSCKCGRLKKHEDELERRVPDGELKARDVVHP